jgi:1-acyl-sn-glycerol-3-phosphate acyltransferase
MNGSRLLGVVRVILFLSLTFAMIPLQMAVLALNPRLFSIIPRWYHTRGCRLLGLDLIVRGTPSRAHPTLFVSNHSSYFDIAILGSLIDCSFIAKADMITWPLFGTLARLQRSVFIDRKPANVGEHANEIAQRLAAGDSLVLFAEGTTSDGNRVLPFKSSLFSVAEQAPPERNLTVQPVSIIATRLDGMPLGRSLRPLYAWYGDQPLMPHAWNAMKAGRLTVEIEFHEPFSAVGMNRKQICARCEAAVEKGVVRGVTGRLEGETAPAHSLGESGDEVEAAA